MQVEVCPTGPTLEMICRVHINAEQRDIRCAEWTHPKPIERIYVQRLFCKCPPEWEGTSHSHRVMIHIDGHKCGGTTIEKQFGVLCGSTERPLTAYGINTAWKGELQTEGILISNGGVYIKRVRIDDCARKSILNGAVASIRTTQSNIGKNALKGI
jgi:hypothetical protein